MALRKVRTEDDLILRKISKEVKEIDEKILILLDDMADTMNEENGVGLAAVQVGMLKRIFIAMFDGENITECINPVVIKKDGEQVGAEGCLSLPGKSGYCRRPLEVVLQYTDRSGERYEIQLQGYAAVMCMHEYDHLDGVLYSDHILSDDEVEEYRAIYGGLDDEYEEEYDDEDLAELE